jgi:hypothetical protein
MNGRKVDALAESIVSKDSETGVASIREDMFRLWADKGSDKAILSVEGVTKIYYMPDGYYQISVDKRYDIEYVKQAVIAAVLCS